VTRITAADCALKREVRKSATPQLRLGFRIPPGLACVTGQPFTPGLAPGVFFSSRLFGAGDALCPLFDPAVRLLDRQIRPDPLQLLGIGPRDAPGDLGVKEG
jgi:hypothetical protein